MRSRSHCEPVRCGARTAATTCSQTERRDAVAVAGQPECTPQGVKADVLGVAIGRDDVPGAARELGGARRIEMPNDDRDGLPLLPGADGALPADVVEPIEIEHVVSRRGQRPRRCGVDIRDGTALAERAGRGIPQRGGIAVSHHDDRAFGYASGTSQALGWKRPIGRALVE
jgi:hypothetical protein